MQLGKCIKSYRHKYEVDIHVLANYLGISASTLSRLENGKSIDLVSFKKILDWLLTEV